MLVQSFCIMFAILQNMFDIGCVYYPHDAIGYVLDISSIDNIVTAAAFTTPKDVTGTTEPATDAATTAATVSAKATVTSVLSQWHRLPGLPYTFVGGCNHTIIPFIVQS
jgi:hypothetical protein